MTVFCAHMILFIAPYETLTVVAIAHQELVAAAQI